ncbi:hypothetical protein EOS_35990 [Caballeronia mineralivorans PML1(12)]|uniref:Uncharacterized protein n=1 Tax=Caballeronia mineralivorans PML1(12) TaxID=908627 RepID=A0A0J1CL07_9BURK|nr:hypothetical protein EOS_35990 [Caballeronia mineralivorans PML1(12)]
MHGLAGHCECKRVLQNLDVRSLLLVGNVSNSTYRFLFASCSLASQNPKSKVYEAKGRDDFRRSQFDSWAIVQMSLSPDPVRPPLLEARFAGKQKAINAEGVCAVQNHDKVQRFEQ